MFSATNQLRTVEWLIRTLAAKAPLVAVVGDVGVGKTTVLEEAAARLADCGRLVVQAPPSAGLRIPMMPPGSSNPNPLNVPI